MAEEALTLLQSTLEQSGEQRQLNATRLATSHQQISSLTEADARIACYDYIEHSYLHPHLIEVR